MANKLYPPVMGGILGSVVGDALGVPAEFRDRESLKLDPITTMVGGGAHGQRAGTWSDDTSMVLCVMDSIEAKGIDHEDVMQRFANWLWKAENTAHGEVFDVGGACKSAIFKYMHGTKALLCGNDANYACGNGSLMRILPYGLYLYMQGYRTLDDACAKIIHEASAITHAHPRCLMACGLYCSIVFGLLETEGAMKGIKTGLKQGLCYYKNKREFASVFEEFSSLWEIETLPEEQIRSGGFVLHTLQAALWCLGTTTTYRECMIKAVNLGDDTDTTAAVAGGLAGILYKEEGIPGEWKATCANYENIRQRSSRFYDACRTGNKNQQNKTV